MTPNPPECRSCGAPIRFLKTAKGKHMPVDREPSELNGNLLVRDGVARVLGTTEAAEAREQGYALYVSHFATCPNARAHRRARDAEQTAAQQRARAARAPFPGLGRSA